MNPPLVSIITPTIASRRNLLLGRCVPSVRRQTYANLEHLVVMDGPDLDQQPLPNGVRFIEMGRSWGRFTEGKSVGSIPRNVGCFLAQGDYLAYLDDDDEFLPDHVEKLVSLIERENRDFVFSRMRRFQGKEPELEVGNGKIECGHIGTPMVLHKAKCLLASGWPCGGAIEDFIMFSAWDKAGLTWAYLPEITVHVYLR